MAGFFCGLSGGRIVLLTTDIQRQPHFPEQKYNGSTSVTDEGESNSGVGNGIGNDGNIQNNLNRQMPHDSGSDHGTGKFLTVHGDDTESPEQSWVWDVYRSSRFVKNVRIVTFKDVNVEEVQKTDIDIPDSM